MRRAIGVLILLISVGSAISFGQQIPPEPPEVHDLEVTADPSAIPADGKSTSTIIATITNYTGPASGFKICFYIVRGPEGARIEPDCSKTNYEGKANSTLRSCEEPGIVEIKACWEGRVCNTTNVTLTSVPKIVDWYNNITGDDNLMITVRDTQAIYFNATADQPIDKWHWFKDGEEVQEWNEPYYITSWPANTDGTHYVNVSAENENGTSNFVNWTITVQDRTPPPKVTGLRAVMLNATAVNLTWDASSAPDCHHYSVYKDGSLHANTTDEFCVISGLSPGAEYMFEVSATDIHDNEGERSDALEIRMPSPPNITLWDPVNDTVTDKEGDNRTFSIEVNQTVDVLWLINGTEVKNETGVTVSKYTNESAIVGTWNVTAVAKNVSTDLSDMHSWIWIVESVVRGVNLTVDGKKYAEKVVAPGENATYVLTVKNTGEREDTFNMSVENVHDADVAVLDRYEVHLQPGSSTNITLTVRDDEEGDYVVNVTAVSMSNASVEDRVTTLTKIRQPKPDLIIDEISPNCDHIFANETNIINIIVKNEGAADADAFNVSVNISGDVKKLRVDNLSRGEDITLNIVDEKRVAGENVYIVVIADYDDDIDELNEENNARSRAETVVNNGYKGKRYTGGDDIVTWKSFALNGSVVYSVGDSRYQGVNWTEYTVNWTASDIPVPANATVRGARLFVYYTWDKGGVMPDGVSMNFNGEVLAYDAHYTDRKGFGDHDYPYGMLAYNVTDAFNKSENTATLTVVGDGAMVAMVAIKGMLLVVVYEDVSEPFREIVMNEGFDLLYGGADQCTTPEEATAYAPFAYTIEDVMNKSARLIAVAPGAGYPSDHEGDLIFNGHVWTDVWSCAGESQIGIAVLDVSAYLNTTANEGAFRSSEDYMEASNAILVMEEKPEDTAAPVVTNPNANPQIIPEDTDNEPLWGELANLSVVVTDESEIASVTINLSSIGGSAVQPMTRIGDSNVWNVSTNASIGSAIFVEEDGGYMPHLLQVTATDEHGYSNTSVSIELMVMRNGDVTSDGKVNFGDGLRIINHYFHPEDPSYSLPSDTIADVTGDGKVNFGDGLRIINHYFHPEDPSYILK